MGLLRSSLLLVAWRTTTGGIITNEETKKFPKRSSTARQESESEIKKVFRLFSKKVKVKVEKSQFLKDSSHVAF